MEQEVVTQLAHIIAGEATGCPVLVFVAVAYIYQKNKTFYGYSNDISNDAMFVAEYWEELPDASFGASFFFSGTDLKQKRVQNLINGPPLVEVARYQCARDTIHLYAYEGQVTGFLNREVGNNFQQQMCVVGWKYGHYFQDCEIPKPKQPTPIYYSYYRTIYIKE